MGKFKIKNAAVNLNDVSNTEAEEKGNHLELETALQKFQESQSSDNQAGIEHEIADLLLKNSLIIINIYKNMTATTLRKREDLPMAFMFSSGKPYIMAFTSLARFADFKKASPGASFYPGLISIRRLFDDARSNRQLGGIIFNMEKMGDIGNVQMPLEEMEKIFEEYKKVVKYY